MYIHVCRYTQIYEFLLFCIHSQLFFKWLLLLLYYYYHHLTNYYYCYYCIVYFQPVLCTLGARFACSSICRPVA
jgi:hypothetical protein